MGVQRNRQIRTGIFQPTLGFLSAIDGKYMKNIWEL